MQGMPIIVFYENNTWERNDRVHSYGIRVVLVLSFCSRILL